MLLAQPDDVLLANQRLATGVDIHVDAQRLALTDDVIDFLIGQVQLVAIFRGPATGTVQVAGRGGVQQDGPGNIAVELLPCLFLDRPADDIGVQKEIFKGGLEHVVVNVVKHLHDQPVHIAVRVFQHAAERCPLRGKAVRAVARQLIHPAQEFEQVFLRILFNVAKRRFHGAHFDTVREAHNHNPFVTRFPA